MAVKIWEVEEMGKPIMAICDRQAAYTSQLISLFQEKKELPFEIHGFTKNESTLLHSDYL